MLRGIGLSVSPNLWPAEQNSEPLGCVDKPLPPLTTLAYTWNFLVAFGDGLLFGYGLLACLCKNIVLWVPFYSGRYSGFERRPSIWVCPQQSHLNGMGGGRAPKPFRMPTRISQTPSDALPDFFWRRGVVTLCSENLTERNPVAYFVGEVLGLILGCSKSV